MYWLLCARCRHAHRSAPTMINLIKEKNQSRDEDNQERPWNLCLYFEKWLSASSEKFFELHIAIYTWRDYSPFFSYSLTYHFQTVRGRWWWHFIGTMTFAMQTPDKNASSRSDVNRFLIWSRCSFCRITNISNKYSFGDFFRQETTEKNRGRRRKSCRPQSTKMLMVSRPSSRIVTNLWPLFRIA